jgi:neuronal PAS domain-containing protein 1/3
VIEKGQVLTHYYRILTKNGGYIWIQTCATIVCNIKNNDEQNIICVNYIITARENVNLVMDQCQLEIVKKEIREPVSTIEKEAKPMHGDIKDDSPPIKVENTTPEPKNSRKTSPPESKTDEPVNRGRKRKNKQDAPDAGKKNSLPPAASLMNDSSCKEQDCSKDKVESSVKDLENAMSKHLPSPSASNATDFSTSTLLKQQDKESNSWTSSASTYSDPQSTAVMPASTLLKQLYANRESVIRAATRPNYIYSDGALPTPPGEYSSAEGYPTNYSNSYASNSVEYNNNNNNNNMTPPGSVSPRDLSSLSGKTSVTNYDYNHYPASNESTILQLPLKPQPYALHNYPDGQYFTHHPGFWYPTPT